MGSLWNRSGTIERYADDLRAAGATAYFFNGGTTSALTVYRDAAGNSAHPNPVVADAHGRWPDVFVPYTLGYDVQVKTAEGVQLTYSQNIPNPDPVELTVTPDPTTNVTTGMIHAEMTQNTKTGYVRLNGRTIGSALSAGTERKNDDTLNLFSYLYNNLSDALAPVSGGRGGSGAAADFGPPFNKTITLPDFRGAMPVGLDDMGSTAGNNFTGLTFLTGNSVTAGSNIGVNSQVLDISQIPAHAHSGTTNQESPTHTHTATTSIQSASHTHTASVGTDSPDHTHTPPTLNDPGHVHAQDSRTVLNQAGGGATGGNPVAITGGTTGSSGSNITYTAPGLTTGASVRHSHTVTLGNQSVDHTHSFTTTDGAHSHTFTTSTAGGGGPMNNLPHSFLVTWFIKL